MDDVNRMVKNLRDLALGKARERKSMTLSREDRSASASGSAAGTDREKIKLRNMCGHSAQKADWSHSPDVNSLESELGSAPQV